MPPTPTLHHHYHHYHHHHHLHHHTITTTNTTRVNNAHGMLCVQNKTTRSWKPNVHRKRFYSEILDKKLRINVTTTALRTMDKYGGIDK
jgi:ribosomal protein L28